MEPMDISSSFPGAGRSFGQFITTERGNKAEMGIQTEPNFIHGTHVLPVPPTPAHWRAQRPRTTEECLRGDNDSSVPPYVPLKAAQRMAFLWRRTKGLCVGLGSVWGWDWAVPPGHRSSPTSVTVPEHTPTQREVGFWGSRVTPVMDGPAQQNLWFSRE